MCVLIYSNRGLILFLFLLLWPTFLQTYSTSLQTNTWQINYLKEVTNKVLKETPADTLLIMSHQQDFNCGLKELIVEGLPVLRLNEASVINLKENFNSELIALVCMSELRDYKLLTTLAKNLHRMREARIIIWLQTQQISLKLFSDIITDHASNYNFLRLIVLHFTTWHGSDSIAAYRLQPFPKPSLERVENLKDGKIFVNVWQNYKGTMATILADLKAPYSLLAKDLFTGKPKLFGISDRVIAEFARKYNIKLRLRRPLSDVGNVTNQDVIEMTFNGELDLPISVFSQSLRVHKKYFDFVSSVDVGSFYILVPCAKDICIGDVYRGLRTYSVIILAVYFIFALLETLMVAITCRILQRRYRFSFGNIFVNLSAFCGVLGLPFSIARYRSSCSLQQLVMIMSFFSLIFSCFFSANLNTLLIKQPLDKQIKNFEELRESNLTVIFDERLFAFIENAMGDDFFTKVMPNTQVLPTKELQRLMFSLNTSYAHHIHTTMLDTLNKYQKRYKQNVLCTSPKLILYSGMILSGILKHNSIYKIALEQYKHWTQSVGIYKHWTDVAYQKLQPSYTTHKLLNSQDAVALSVSDLTWLWKLVAYCYFVSVVIFGLEILMARWVKRGIKRVIVV